MLLLTIWTLTSVIFYVQKIFDNTDGCPSVIPFQGKKIKMINLLHFKRKKSSITNLTHILLIQ